MLHTPITDCELTRHLASLPEDGREVFVALDATARITSVGATTMINQMQANHGLQPLETYVLGQAYLATALLTSLVEGNDRIQLSIECGGPIGGIYTEGWADGSVRGYLKNNPIPLTKELTSLDLDELYGPGFLTLSRLLEGKKTPFTGQTMLQWGNLAKDLATHFDQSEQTPTHFILSIDFNENARVIGAGALFIQAMPGWNREGLDRLADLADGLPSLGKHIAGGRSVRSFVETHFTGVGLRHLDSTEIRFFCPCTREQYGRYIRHLSESDRADIAEHGPFPFEVVCSNCNTSYRWSRDELLRLLGEVK
ncbi:MAG: Hsp33 family molecular chaperone HslO [Spirochaetales bacterium]|nr:Hsp33 family molecular chaperone HslO [Spirochaetales bacterium]